MCRNIFRGSKHVTCFGGAIYMPRLCIVMTWHDTTFRPAASKLNSEGELFQNIRDHRKLKKKFAVATDRLI